MSNMNVVSLLDRIKTGKLNINQDALENDYELSAEDVHTFLMVLRQIQKRSRHQEAQINVSDDSLEIKVTDIADNTADTNNTNYMDFNQQTRTLFFNVPWFLWDLDKSEISRDSNGIDAIEHFSSVLLTRINTLSVDH